MRPTSGGLEDILTSGFRASSVKAKVGKDFCDVKVDGTLSAVAKEGEELQLGLSYAYDPKPEEAGSVSGSFSVKVLSDMVGSCTRGSTRQSSCASSGRNAEF